MNKKVMKNALMKRTIFFRYLMLSLTLIIVSCGPEQIDLSQFPNTVISNENVRMVVYLPDPDKGIYRATRFDWSGVIGSVQYKDHEYFGYWKDSHDPMFHEDLMGPVESYNIPGLGYEEAVPGGKFIRIGVGVLEKVDELGYNWRGTYNILDNGIWTIDSGDDWISFNHEVTSDIGFGYNYLKTIKLKSDGFLIKHRIINTGQKSIETDQYNHNFFMIDGVRSGPSFGISFPFDVITKGNLKDFLEKDGKELRFIKEIKSNDFLGKLGENRLIKKYFPDDVYLELEGYSDNVSDHRISVSNKDSGAGVVISVDKPLASLAFWACKTTLCPENSVWISVEPMKEMEWTSEYSLF